MYIVGLFERDYFGLTSNDKPMSLTWIKDNIDKRDLIKAKEDDNFQVLDIDNFTYYDPIQNKWIELEKL